MILSLECRSPLSEARELVLAACAAHKFGVLSVLDLKERMKEKGVAYDGECLIFEVCQPLKAKQALEANPEISTALPCRISLYRGRDGKTRLSTIRPTALMAIFEAAELKGLAEEVEATLAAIMEEAAR